MITRKYPPSIGGMQWASYRLTTEISRHCETRIIAWGGSPKLLPFFLCLAFARSIAIGIVHRIELIHLGDPVLAPLGIVLGRLFRVPVVVTVHGLDVTYPNLLYQLLMPRFLRACDMIVAISSAARDECLHRGVQRERSMVVPIGVDLPAFDLPTRDMARQNLENSFGITLNSRKVLLTSGRLVQRKGVAWFIDLVLPTIVAHRPDVVYLVVGSGPDEGRIREAIARRGLSGSVHVLGEVSAKSLWTAYRASDIFLMPNISVPGDLEGFGLVAIEAGIVGTCVVASDLEGIRDAVWPERNGILVTPHDATAFASTIDALLGDDTRRQALGRSAQAFVRDRFAWPRIAEEYVRLFNAAIHSASPVRSAGDGSR